MFNVRGEVEDSGIALRQHVVWSKLPALLASMLAQLQPAECEGR